MRSMKDIEYPIRLNKYLAYTGVCSRREADTLIAKGKVFINGTKATLGLQVQEGDNVELHRGYKKESLYFAYNKPRGIVTHSPQKDEVDILSSLERDDIYPIGRLDKDSEGLIILTNDGRITEKLLSPGQGHEKEYVVSIDKQIRKGDAVRLGNGVQIEKYLTKPCIVKQLSSKTISITLTEGKRHQIRRMLAALGYAVTKLKRVRVGSVLLNGLEQNELRALERSEYKKFLAEIGL